MSRHFWWAGEGDATASSELRAEMFLSFSQGTGQPPTPTLNDPVQATTGAKIGKCCRRAFDCYSHNAAGKSSVHPSCFISLKLERPETANLKSHRKLRPGSEQKPTSWNSHFGTALLTEKDPESGSSVLEQPHLGLWESIVKYWEKWSPHQSQWLSVQASNSGTFREI